MEAPEGVVKTVKDFAKGSLRLVKRCTKPDRKGGRTNGLDRLFGRPGGPTPADRASETSWGLREGPRTAPTPTAAEFKKVTGITALGFIAAGFIGFFIKLIFIVSRGRGARGSGGGKDARCAIAAALAQVVGGTAGTGRRMGGGSPAQPCGRPGHLRPPPLLLLCPTAQPINQIIVGG
jgi:preprotein translocase subunit Sss1